MTASTRPSTSENPSLVIDRCEGIASVQLNRPAAANALDAGLWWSLASAFAEIDTDPSVRVVVLSGAGRHFCAGIDLQMLDDFSTVADDPCAGRGSEALLDRIIELQRAVSAIEGCRTPVIAAISGACIGAGLDIAAACDVRLAAADARFCLKEVDLGVTADVGVLQRLPRIIGEGLARELALTARTVDAQEARAIGLVTGVSDDRDGVLASARELAATIAARSPLAVRGTKRALNFARDHPIGDGLEQVALWNAATLLSADLAESLAAARDRRTPTYRD
ncbi:MULTISPECIES: crotonase/enoyl-CoA hydratase family protein [unclassified Gordonia (in: high G+C Gram-positive bacteria)]|uniref:crotonase/enoyl-CoA hydratase family protein n=1 Tax=unclassified Gordonia (in: high G+C Gram-positive bacteria) TaxID=2657482 RepID=UPI0011183FF4|nr:MULTISPECIES: crotonase/enoyl-CoA hydratase family protein [unclassified Gordonia (in: high G+C Gram-positive bacteria)]MDF3284139.1 crotonase/enoyl-CoA hydratase family protein [Gordonia sp. N1V]